MSAALSVLNPGRPQGACGDTPHLEASTLVGPRSLLCKMPRLSNGVGCVVQALRQCPGEAKGTLQSTDNQSTVPSACFPSSESWPWRPEFQGPESDGRRVQRGPVTPHVVAGAGTRQVESPLSTCQEGGPWGKPHGDTYALRPPSSMCLLVTWGERKQSGVTRMW